MSVNYISSFFDTSIGINEQIQQIFDSPEVKIWYRDFEHNTLWNSKGYAAIFGYSQEDFEKHPMLWLESVYMEDKWIVENASCQHLLGISTEVEFRIIRSNGQIGWIKETVTPIVDKAGRVTAICGSVYDITEQKMEICHLRNELGQNSVGPKVEDILIEYQGDKKGKTFQNPYEHLRVDELLNIAREELNETIRLQQGMIYKFKNIDGAFIHTLCDGELLYRLGLNPMQVVGKELFDFLPTEIAEDNVHCYQRAWNGEERVTYEVEMNGISFLTALSPIKRGGKVVEVIGSCIDITDLKNAEKALLESQANYRLIAENMTDLVILFDIDGNCMYASPSHESVLGYSSDFFETNNSLHLIHPEDLSMVANNFEKVINRKESIKLEYRLKHANGDWKLFESTASPVIGENGSVEHIIVVTKDVTEKRRAEELLSKSEKLSLVGELAAGVAHEIRNPLTSIKGFIQLFQQGIRKEEYFHVILKEFNRIEDIIKEFLSLAKPQEIQLKPVYIPSLLKEVETLLDSELHLKNLEFVTEIEPNIPFILCDANQIKQVLLNLCKNSIEALDKNKNGVIKLHASIENNKQLLIKVIDNGVGISAERLKRLGEPFYSNKEKGTGLGLMICFRIIKEHNGTIIFNSAKNQGTTVNIRLPLFVGD
jgi:PAS domain S-box-containing protein